MSDETELYLVLCVDRDDDLGTKGKVETPVVGREAVLAAANKLALADPEEADANAMFASVKKYDELVRAGTPCEVAVVCGDSGRGFEADRRVGREIARVAGGREYTGVVLVSDGGDDELVIPVIQGVRPVVSVHRVAVKHSQTVEETYQVLGRYLRMLVFDPHYSKWTLGVPGLIFILGTLLIITQHVFEAELAALFVLGGAFLIRGFSFDRAVAGLLHRGPTGYIRLFTAITSLLVIIVGIFTGYSSMVKLDPGGVQAVVTDPGQFFVVGGNLIGYLISGSLALVVAGTTIYTTGALLSHLVRESVRWRRELFVLVMLALLYLPIQIFADFLKGGSPESTFLLIAAILIGLAGIFSVTAFIYPKFRTKTTAKAD